MKLYTEEQVKDMLDGFIGSIHVDAFLKRYYTPIELPSDENIRKIMELDDMEFDEFDPYHISHLEGVKWMRDKLTSGNNERK